MAKGDKKSGNNELDFNSNVPQEKKEAIQTAMLQIEKQYGNGSIMRLGDRKAKANMDVIPTGCLVLDEALGIGGVPRGRVVEIYGPESSGKTTLTLHIMAEAQKQGGIAAMVDAEHAMDPIYAANIGVNTSDLLISQPDYGEEALEITEALVRSGAVDVVVVDSVAALVPKAEIDGEMGDTHVGLQARLMSQALRKLTSTIAKSKTTVIFINQIRMKIGVMFGSPETTTGGNALKFYSSVRLDIRRKETIKKGEEAVGNVARVKVAKNKTAAPFKQCEFEMMYDHGISYEGCLLEAGLKYNLINKAGTWYSYGDERIGQGRDNAKNFLKDNPEIAQKIDTQVRTELGWNAKPEEDEGPPEQSNKGKAKQKSETKDF